MRSISPSSVKLNMKTCKLFFSPNEHGGKSIRILFHWNTEKEFHLQKVNRSLNHNFYHTNPKRNLVWSAPVRLFACAHNEHPHTVFFFSIKFTTTVVESTISTKETPFSIDSFFFFSVFEQFENFCKSIM